MRERLFIDTNILVYAKLEENRESDKNKTAGELLKKMENKLIIRVLTCQRNEY